MLNERAMALGSAPNKIRELFMYGLDRKAEIGAENVFDFSLGNPSIPAPAKVTEVARDLLDGDPVALHGYSPSPGIPAVRNAIADHITRFYGIQAKGSHVYITSGASSALIITMSAISQPGEEIVIPTPYFPEYDIWANSAGCSVVEVPARQTDFQLDVPAMAAAINEKTCAILVNSPNNPVGAVYTQQNLEELAEMLRAKEQELGRDIYIIADEPYRELTYGAEVPYIPAIYKHTIVCYSYSKSLSLPGERIGYVYVSDRIEEADDVFTAVCGAGRSYGYICASVLWQNVVAACVDEPSDIEAYRSNRKLLTDGLDELGYEYVEPDGAFYLWVKALEDDDEKFCEEALKHELILVPSTCFKGHGWVRVSYCIAAKTIADSMKAFKALKESYEK